MPEYLPAQTFDGEGNLISEEPNAVDVTETRNEGTVNTRLDEALATLATFVASAKPSTAAAQASAAYDATKLLARVAIGLIRLLRRRLDSAD